MGGDDKIDYKEFIQYYCLNAKNRSGVIAGPIFYVKAGLF